MNSPTKNMIQILLLDSGASVRLNAASKWYVESSLQIEDAVNETRQPIRGFGTTPEAAIGTFLSALIQITDENHFIRNRLHRYKWNAEKKDFDSWILKEL